MTGVPARRGDPLGRSALDFVVLGWRSADGMHFVAASRTLTHGELRSELQSEPGSLLTGLTRDFERVRPAGRITVSAVGKNFVLAAAGTYAEALATCLRGWNPDGDGWPARPVTLPQREVGWSAVVPGDPGDPVGG